MLKQGGRTGVWQPEAALRHLGELLGGQAALATPLLFVLFAAGLAAAVRRWRDPAWALLAALSLPGVIIFVQHALGDRVQANWVAPVYPAAALAAAGLGWRGWRAAAGLGFGMTALAYVQAAAAPFPLPRRLDPALIRLGGWDGLARDADAMRVRLGGAFLAAEDYAPASLLAWWAPGGTMVLGAEHRWSLFRLAHAVPAGPGLLLLSERRGEPPDAARWAQADPAGRLVRSRGGVEAEAFRVYRVVPRADVPSALLPRPGG